MSIHSLTAEQRFEAGHLGRLWWGLLGAVFIHLALLLALPHPHFQAYRLPEQIITVVDEIPPVISIPQPPKEIPKQDVVTEIAPSTEADPDATIPSTVPDIRAPYIEPAVAGPRPFVEIFDTPPVPIKQVRPVYPELARQAELEGVVVLKVGIDEFGEVKEALVLQSVQGLDEAALDAVYQWRFRPGKQRDVPVPVWIVIPVRFSLNG